MAAEEFDAPKREWTTLVSADLAQDVGVTTALLAALVANAEHLKEVLYGRGTYAGGTAHDHKGSNGNPLRQRFAWNVLKNSAPWKGMGTDPGDGDWYWDGKTATTDEYGFHFEGSKSGYAWQMCPPRDQEDHKKWRWNAKAAWGSSADVTVSLYAKLTGTATQGKLSFGFADGSIAFLENESCTVDYTDLTTSWKRFYSFMTIDAAKEDKRFMVATDERFDCGLRFTAMMVAPGHGLTYWVPCRLDRSEVGEWHWSWYNIGIADCPIFEKAASITSAVRLYPY